MMSNLSGKNFRSLASRAKIDISWHGSLADGVVIAPRCELPETTAQGHSIVLSPLLIRKCVNVVMCQSGSGEVNATAHKSAVTQ